MESRPRTPAQTRTCARARRLHTGKRSRALAISVGVLCIAACEYSQLLFVMPAAASPLGLGDESLLAQARIPPVSPEIALE
jgi:hypothetical protein